MLLVSNLLLLLPSWVLLPFSGAVGWNTSITSSQKARAGMPSALRAASNDISSDSVLELMIEPCVLQNHEIGTNVFGPISTRKDPEVLLLSPRHAANEASANNAN